MEKETISIYTIAKEAGVSPATVSRVLTGNAKVSEEKKSKVEALIRKYDFRPNALARGLSSVETKMIGLMVSDIRNPFYATMAVECEKAANENGYLLLLCNSLGSNEMEVSYLEKFSGQRVDAIIQIGGKVDELVSDTSYVENINRVANTTPILITGKLDGADCYQVNIDEGQSMELLMQFLIENGHQDIALMGGRDNVKSTLDKRLRYRRCFGSMEFLSERNTLWMESAMISKAAVPRCTGLSERITPCPARSSPSMTSRRWGLYGRSGSRACGYRRMCPW